MKFQNSLLSYSCLSVQLPSLAISPLSSFLEMRDFLLLFGSCHSAAKPQRLLSCSKKLSGAGGRHSLPLRLPDLLCFMGVGGGWTGTTTQLLPRDWCRLSAALWSEIASIHQGLIPDRSWERWTLFTWLPAHLELAGSLSSLEIHSSYWVLVDLVE